MEKADPNDQVPKKSVNINNSNFLDIDMLGQKPRFLDQEKAKADANKLIEEVKGKPIPETKEEKKSTSSENQMNPQIPENFPFGNPEEMYNALSPEEKVEFEKQMALMTQMFSQMGGMQNPDPMNMMGQIPPMPNNFNPIVPTVPSIPTVPIVPSDLTDPTNLGETKDKNPFIDQIKNMSNNIEGIPPEENLQNDYMKLFEQKMQETFKNNGIDLNNPNIPEDQMMEKMSSMFINVVKENQNNPMFNQMLEMMGAQFMSKELMYPPMVQLRDSYPQYLTENKSKLTNEEYERYSKQLEKIIEICTIMEKDEKNYSNLFGKVTELHNLGRPPEEIASKVQMPEMNQLFH